MSHDDPVAEIVREDRRRRQLGPDAQCAICGERVIWALVRRGDQILCYEHDALRQGRSPNERHHTIGRHNASDIIVLPGNAHRILSAYRVGWPMKTQRNPHRSPLLVMSAAIRSERDSQRLQRERIDVLELLDEWLCETLGPDWPQTFERFRQERP